MQQALEAIVGKEHVKPPTTREYLEDATAIRGLSGRADGVVLPGSAEEVCAVMRWCYENDVALIPRGGGTGYAGGAVPIDGGVVVSLERLKAVLEFDPPASAAPGKWTVELVLENDVIERHTVVVRPSG